MTKPVTLPAPESSDQMDSGTPSITTTECDYCGKGFKVEDSYTLREDGTFKSCIHWPQMGAYPS